MPKISVIMPVYNAERFLGKAIDSIIEQTYTDWELIIIDDGSTDSSDTIIKSYSDKRIRYYRNDKNLGLIETLNKGIDFCKGDFIARMDADDISMPERFRLQYEFLNSHNDYALCGSYAKVIDDKDHETGKILNLQFNNYLQVNLLFSVPFIHPSVMIRAEVLKKNPYKKEYKHAEDYELWCRIANAHKVANIPHDLLKYRWHASNVSVLNSQIQKNIKNVIIQQGLNGLGLIPSDRELYLHGISFHQYDAKEKVDRQKFEDFEELDVWYSKIIAANNTYKRYIPEALISYLWSRWIVLCISQKRYSKIFKPNFVPLDIKIFIRTLRLIYFFSKK